ncbi:MAG TPA: GNAT family N-acetyltransferase [Acidimicrobiales bacterium]
MTLLAGDLARVRQLFDEQVRQGTASDGTGSVVTSTPHAVRWSANGDNGWSEVAWSNLDDTSADAEIARHVEYFSDRGQSFAWRVYDADLPNDLGPRLERAGFTLEYTSELMVAEAADIPQDVTLPAGVELSFDNDERGIDRLIEVHEKVFGSDHSSLRRSLRTQLVTAPHVRELVVAISNGEPISSSRIEFLPDRQFASLWGGSTLPEWRGKGLFRAMVAYRADIAAQRGYPYLYVTASSESRPILERISFSPLGSVFTYMWQPSSISS